jgi:hypothetical protein
MTRANGRKGHTGRPVTVTPEEARNIGLSDLQNPEGSPVPGLTGNIKNVATTRQRPATGEDGKREFDGWLAHGVESGAETHHERAAHERGGAHRASPGHSHAAPYIPPPVPVTIVQGDKGNVFISAAPRHITIPNSGTDPVRLCGRSHRIRIGFLNEDTAVNIRFATRPSDLGNGGGALLPYVVNSYSWFQTQDELYAVTTSSTVSVVLSIIEEYDQEF